MGTGMTLPRGVVADRLDWNESREPLGPEVQADQLGCRWKTPRSAISKPGPGVGMHYPEVPTENLPEVAK